MGLTTEEMQKAIDKDVSPDFSRQTSKGFHMPSTKNASKVPSFNATALSTFSIGTDPN